ncbi:MAG: D-alanyl-D-alanine carboxypeptidase family protein [Acidimicrobiales bacterium]
MEGPAVDAEQAAKAREVDAANAELGDLTNAVAVLRGQVEAQRAKVAAADEQLAAARQHVADTEAEVAAAEEEVAVVEVAVEAAAIRTFTGDESGRAALLIHGDPNRVLRMEQMRVYATKTDLELIEDLRAAQEDLDARRREAIEAVAEAEHLQQFGQQELETLERDQAAQGRVTAAAERRLDHLLAERAALGGEAPVGDTDALASQLAASPAPGPVPVSDVAVPDVVGEDEIAYAGNGIYVHQSIVDPVRQLLADAAAAGLDLGGGGYRSASAQIATRRANCGTSNYAIYEMPASRCSPPTARPGRSMHERGLAIDFTYNGSLIRSRSGGGWNWLKANAARYGLSNLPSEPWHWSTNGN